MPGGASARRGRNDVWQSRLRCAMGDLGINPGRVTSSCWRQVVHTLFPTDSVMQRLGPEEEQP